MEKLKIKYKNKEIETLYLKNLLELTLGLMFRRSGTALMEMPYFGKPGIWMLFMKFHLDIYFLDENLKIVDFIKKVPPLTINPKTWKVYHPKKDCKYVLEIDSGRGSSFSLGDKIILIRK